MTDAYKAEVLARLAVGKLDDPWLSDVFDAGYERGLEHARLRYDAAWPMLGYGAAIFLVWHLGLEAAGLAGVVGFVAWQLVEWNRDAARRKWRRPK